MNEELPLRTKSLLMMKNSLKTFPAAAVGFDYDEYDADGCDVAAGFHVDVRLLRLC